MSTCAVKLEHYPEIHKLNNNPLPESTGNCHIIHRSHNEKVQISVIRLSNGLIKGSHALKLYPHYSIELEAGEE